MALCTGSTAHPRLTTRHTQPATESSAARKDFALTTEKHPHSFVRTAFALCLLAIGCAAYARAQQNATASPDISTSSSYGLLDGFHSSASALPASPAPPAFRVHPVETSISVGGFGQFTATRFNSSFNTFTTESINPTAGVLATVRQSFKPWLGYSINMGFTRASEHYSVNATSDVVNNTNNAYLLANMYEYSASYVAEKRITPRLSGFADLGGGVVVFQPTQGGTGAVITPPFTNYRPEGVGGFGIDYSLSHHLGLRAEYRGQLYKFADYGARFARDYTITSEPTISITYTFGRASTTKQ